MILMPRYDGRRVSRPRSICPDCGKKGVTLRLRPHGEDHYGCRYCDWYFFADVPDQVDREQRERFWQVNPDQRPNEEVS